MKFLKSAKFCITPTFKIPINFEMFQAYTKFLKNIFRIFCRRSNNVGDHIVPNQKQNLVKIVQKSWAAFATNGNPDNEFIPHWEKYSANNRQTMELNSKKCILHKDLNTENLNSLRYLYES